MDSTPATTAGVLPFRFHGNATEYFRIWIVNVMLTVLTLGIYSAWAKVRNKRYFYNNTELDGSGFDYHADPQAILKGRLIAVAVFTAYSVTSSAVPAAQPAFLLAFLFALPWVVIRTMAFNTRNSSFRNIRFNFRAGYRDAARVYILFVLLIPLTLGLAYPYFEYRHRDFMIRNSEFGTSEFDFDARAGQFFSIYARAFGLLVLAVLAAGIVLPGLVTTAHAAASAAGGKVPTPPSPANILPALLMLGMYMMAGIYLRTATSNLVLNHAAANGHRFISTLQTRSMLWIYLTNLAAIVASLGLLIPWAKIRLMHYRMDNLKLQPRGGLDNFIAGEQTRVMAAGEELAGIFDIDLGL